jgi:hypothetical protein
VREFVCAANNKVFKGVFKIEIGERVERTFCLFLFLLWGLKADDLALDAIPCRGRTCESEIDFHVKTQELTKLGFDGGKIFVLTMSNLKAEGIPRVRAYSEVSNETTVISPNQRSIEVSESSERKDSLTIFQISLISSM